MYLLEAIKARGAVDLIKQYRDSGKKVVVFHDFKKGGSIHPFQRSNVPQELQAKYNEFASKRADLINLDLGDLQSPISTLKSAFGEDVLLFNGDISKKDREKNVQLFNDDASKKDIILVQSDAGQAGISLHDTTGKHQRVLLNLGMPVKPVAAIQIEGRIYRVGQKSNAIFRYLNTGTNTERMAFASKIAERASTAENLALGNEARNLKDAFVSAFEDTLGTDTWKDNLPGSEGEGIGGKAKDRATREALTEFDRAKTFYYGRGKKNAKTKSAEGNDYFATPEPLGYKMVEWANIKQGEKVLEPSAGHGAISRWFPSNTENVMIEPSKELATSAQMSSNGKLVSSTFEDYYVGNKFDSIVMNPPFGSGGKTAIEHVAKAYKQLRDGGRIVAIVPDGPSCQKHFNKWF
ncbi:MAG: type restriction enzyme res subunit family protein, partial [Paenibacillus sp.]|nr:type restriction enzyme res subunit family protein [Paenibacillus sp.]